MSIISKSLRLAKSAQVIFREQETTSSSQTDDASFQSINDYLYAIRPEIDLLDENEYAYKIVYAPMQSGKTSMLICKSIQVALTGLNVIIVVRNFKMDVIQLKTRLNDTIIDIKKKLKNKSIKTGVCDIDVVMVKEDLRSTDLVDNDNAGKIILMLGNTAQYNKLDRMYHSIDEDKRNTWLMIDEIDINIKSSTTNLGNKLLTNNNWNIIQRVGVTATSMGLIFSNNNLKSTQLIVLNPSSQYKGICRDGLTIYESRLNESVWEVYDEINTSLYSYETKSGKGHPYIFLNKSSTLKANHYDTAIDCYNRYFEDTEKDWFHITVNDHGVLVVCDTILFKVSRDWKTGQYDKILEKRYNLVDGEYYEFQEDLSSVLQIIKLNIESRKTKKEIQNTVINIIGGMCFSRGISIVSRDYEWHINGEYFKCSNVTDCGSILQSLRICGVFQDEIPLQLWTTPDIKKHILAYHSLQTRIVGLIKDTDKNVKEALEKLMVLDEELGIKRQLGRGEDGKNVKLKYTRMSGEQECYVSEDLLEATNALNKLSEDGCPEYTFREKGIYKVNADTVKVFKLAKK